MKRINTSIRAFSQSQSRRNGSPRLRWVLSAGSAILLAALLGAPLAGAAPELSKEENERAQFIYFDRCSGCHGALRKGATGPNITAEKMLKRKFAELEDSIFNGTDAGMPGWGRTGELTAAESTLMAKFVQLPAPIPPEMGLKAMKATHKVHVPVADRPTKPQHGRNIDNHFGVILRDAGQAAIVDGDTKKLISVMDSGHAVHIFRASATGRYFYTVGRDGKLNLIDLWEEKPRVVAESRVCLDARSVDVSKYKGPKGDFVDKYAVVGCYWPPQMVVVDGKTLEPIKVISTRSSTYDTNEYHPEPRVATIVASHHAPEWVVAIKETGLVWLVDYSDLDNLSMTQIATERFLHDGGFDATGRYLLIAANMRDQIVVVDTKKRKFVTKFETGVKPHPGRGANWVDPEYGPVSATTHLGEGLIAVYGSDPEGHPEHAWKVVREEETAGPGLFLKTHPKSNHVWTDSTLSKEEGVNQEICVFKKDDFAAGPNCWRAADHGKVVHFEYNKAGDEVWAAVWDKKGELIIYDDKTLKEKQRIKGDWLVTPTGKWNVYNTVNDIY
ncbi:MAG: c-type cytochrome [Deltaproteobacteria bacterium]|nr:c-type cytochrome [Deltaproteobacteria bacterium]